MKKMNKKGFTLIELLAIIVILAIIAVITVPIILNIIENARQGAASNSVIGYGKSVELAYTQYQYDANLGSTQTVTPDPTSGKTIVLSNGTGASKVGTMILAVEFDGDKVVCDAEDSYLDNGKVVIEGCHVNGSTTTYRYENGKATKTN